MAKGRHRRNCQTTGQHRLPNKSWSVDLKEIFNSSVLLSIDLSAFETDSSYLCVMLCSDWFCWLEWTLLRSKAKLDREDSGY